MVNNTVIEIEKHGLNIAVLSARNNVHVVTVTTLYEQQCYLVVRVKMVIM